MSRERAWLDLDTVEAAIPAMEERDVSQVARSDRGFIAQYAAAEGDPDDLSDVWRDKRNAFLARHIAQASANGEPWWRNGEPTRRHLALVAWAYSPTRAKFERWVDDWVPRRANPWNDGDENDPRRLPPTRRVDRHEHSKNPLKRYTQSHWGVEPTKVYSWDRVPDDVELTEMGKIVELQYALDDNGDVGILDFFVSPKARKPDILCFIPDNTERLFLAMSDRSLAKAQKLWVRGAATYTLSQVAKAVGGRQARKTYPWEKGFKVQAIGPCVAAVYHTHKDGDGPSDYEHEMGEWGGVPPMLCVSEDGQLWFAGGSYLVHNDGITR